MPEIETELEDQKTSVLMAADDFARFLFRLPEEHRPEMMAYLKQVLQETEAEEQANSRRAA